MNETTSSTDRMSCISHKKVSRFFVIYEDFLDVAKVSEHQYKLAAFWRILETKTNDRMVYNQELVQDCRNKGVPVPEISLWVELSYSECVKRSLGVYKASSFQVAAAESERLGFSKSRLQQRHIRPNDPDSPLEDYKEYFFCTDVMQKAIIEGVYPTPVEINSPLLKSIAIRKGQKKQKTPIENNSTPVLISTSPPIEINTKKNNKGYYKNEDTKNILYSDNIETSKESDNAFACVTNASAETPPLSLSQESEQSEQPVEVVATPQMQVQQPSLPEKKPRRSRATKSASITTSLLETLDEDMRARVMRVYETFDTLKRETMDNPLVRYGRTDESTQFIQSLIENESPTEEGLRHVYLKMWETPKDVHSGFYWREHMDIKNVCKQYPKLIMTMPKKKAPVVASTTVVNADGAGNTTPMVEVDLEQFITPTMRRLRAREAAWLASTQQTAQKGQEHA